MSLAQSLRPTLARLSGLAGILGLSLLAGCAYQGGYYDPSPGYGYDYGYGGYGYGYGGYGYGYGGYGYGYGSPCWPYGCNDWKHRHHRRHHWDDDNDMMAVTITMGMAHRAAGPATIPIAKPAISRVIKNDRTRAMPSRPVRAALASRDLRILTGFRNSAIQRTSGR